MNEFSPYSCVQSQCDGFFFRDLNNKGVLVGDALMRWGEEPVTFQLPPTIQYQGNNPLAINEAGQLAGRFYIASPCAAPISPTLRAHGSGAEIGTIDVQPGSFCPWYAESSVPWITFTASVGANQGKVKYSLAANTGGSRTGTITVGGNTATITQADTACAYSTTSTAISVSQTGGSGSIPITTQTVCAWQAATLAPWVTISGSGPGSGNVSYTVAANSTYSARSAVLNVAGMIINVTQSGLPCVYTLGSLQPVPAAGSTQALSITTPGACSWQAVASASWVMFNAPRSGSGNGAVSFTVGVNPGVLSRSATITVGGQSVTIVQLPSNTCTFELNPSYMSFNGAGGSSAAALYTGDGCSWTAASDSPWITINSGGTGTTTGTINYSVAANGTGSPRSGSIRAGALVITIVQAVPFTPTALRFVPLTPCRLVETRPQYNFEGRTGAFGPPFLTAAETRTFVPQQSNVCSVPASARAYVANVTLIPRAGGVDFVTLWPSGDPRPGFWNVRSPDGQTVANSAIVRAGAGGAVSVYSSGSADLLVDISGYYTDSSSVNGLAFYPLTPCRVIDTRSLYRSSSPPFGPPSIAARETRKFRLPSSPYCQVPPAAAYSVTLTVAPPAALAYITAWPDGKTQPNVSSINSFAGRTLANNVIIPASADGTIDVFAFDGTDFLMDINGYFASDNGTTGQFYFPVTQCRVSDSTVSGGSYGDDAARTVNLPAAPGCPGIPAQARGFAINVTALPNSNPMPFLTAYPTGEARPNASILNASQGQVVTNSAFVPAGLNGAIDIYAYRNTDVVVEVSGYFGR
ncbi:MAG: BACON domain-containing protein [Acidobacteria bacterium]|nr:BACON domain-containing protein [Acidobacteriota bacterium]